MAGTEHFIVRLPGGNPGRLLPSRCYRGAAGACLAPLRPAAEFLIEWLNDEWRGRTDGASGTPSSPLSSSMIGQSRRWSPLHCSIRSTSASRIVMVIQQLPSPLRRPRAPQQHRARHHADRGKRHRGASDHRVEQPHAGERDTMTFEEEGPGQVLAELAARGFPRDLSAEIGLQHISSLPRPILEWTTM